MQPKLVRIIPKGENGLPPYTKTYEFECVVCGNHYTTRRSGNDLLPYCWRCCKKRDAKKREEKIKQKDQEKINKVLYDIKSEIISVSKKESIPDHNIKQIINIIDEKMK